MKNAPLLRHDLDELTCGHPDCTANHHGVPVSGRCHPEAPSFVIYNQSVGTLIFVCAICRGRLTEIQVAAEAPAAPNRTLTTAELDALGYDA